MGIQVGTYDITQVAKPVRQIGRRLQTGATRVDEIALARALGWFSIGLGLAEVVAPRKVARLVGTRNHRGTVRMFGLREIASGITILSGRRPAGGLWSRVGGDILDLAFLGSNLASRDADRKRALAATAAVTGVTVLDAVCAQRLSAREGGREGVVRGRTSVIVNRPPEECYRFWRDFENLPRFMSYLESIRTIGDRRWHWVAKAPGDIRIEWDAEMVDDTPNERISWRSLPGADVPNSGSVRFERAPGGRGTIVRIEMAYGRPGHAIAAAFAKLVGKVPEQLVYKDLRRFKQVLETGEVITTEGQPAGRTSSVTWLDAIAR
jgi:uncharacterized membrane protein